MGQSKALLDWRGIPFVRAAALEAIAAGLDPVIVIAGNDAKQIQDVVRDLPVKVVINSEWQTGQSSSIRVGLKCLPEHIGGAVFQLVDQPQIPQTLLRQLVLEHSLTLAPIILPESGGRRANPGLFDRKVFPELMKLQGDIGGRGIFSHFPLRTIPWNDEVILLDVDTPEDYQNLISYSK
jgi:molybdenum cofactor cytidylyltransferase